MARSRYIYLLMTDSYESDIVAAFTVKHEAITARDKLQAECQNSLVRYELYRLSDNGKPYEDLKKVES